MSSYRHGLTTADTGVRQEHVPPAMISQSVSQWVDASVPQRGRSLASYLEIPFVNKRLILSCSLIGILAGWAAIVLFPRSYESEAKLMVKVGRENVSLDPTATTGPNLMSLQKTQEEEIASVLEVLRSRQVAEKVVEVLSADVIMSGDLPDTKEKDGDVTRSAASAASQRWESIKIAVDEWFFSVLQSAGIKDDVSNRELAIRQIQSTVDIEAPKKSSVVTINSRAATPQMAQAIVKEVTESFLNEHLNGAYTNGSYEFFLKQSNDAERQLNDLVAARAKFMEENQIVSIEESRELLSAQITGIDRDVAVASGQLEQAVAEIDDLKSKLLTTDDEIVAAKVEGSNETWSGMRQQIYELELEGQRLDATLTDIHPRLKRSRAQLDGAREILQELDSERVDENTTPNPIKMGLQQELQQKETLVVGLRSMIEEKREQQRKLEVLVKELPEQERQLTQIDRDIELGTASLRVMRQKLEEARVIEDLHASKFSNIHVFQPATFVERAASPDKKILGAGFLLLGLMTGVALSFLREGSSPTLRTNEDVEFRLGAPVVANVPRLKNMSSARLKTRKGYRQRCQSLVSEILMSQHRSHPTRGRSVGIIGVDVGAGASTLAVNLAIASDVDCHLKTVLVDADSRNRSVSKMLGLDGAPGLVELLSGTASHDECLQKVDSGEIELIATSADTSTEILSNSAPEIVQALEAYLQGCDLLIVDLPAASQPDQAVALAQHLDCILVVVESEKSKTAATERLLNRLHQSNTEVIGVVLTKTRSYLPKFVRAFVAPQA